MSLLEIRNLKVKVDNHEILKGLEMDREPGEVPSIMGPNGSGKSTLAQVLARRESYDVTSGEILYNGKDLLAMKPEDAACEGIFMAFQYPVEIPGISNAYFLRSALNAIRKYRGEDELDAMDFLPMFREKLKLLDMDEKLMNRSVNEGFSGGEKKRNEILQMAVLEPKLAILDETDSGLDIDALRIVANGVNAMRSPDRAIIVVTHYQRLLNYIVPDFVHVLVNGRIVRSGRSEEHTSELQSLRHLVCRLLLEKKNKRDTRGQMRTKWPSNSRKRSSSNVTWPWWFRKPLSAWRRCMR